MSGPEKEKKRKKEFFEQIDRIVPWAEWIALIQPFYYKGERGNKPYELELMLRIYMIQNLYNLSDMGTVAEVIDSRAFSEFCEVDSSNQVPDEDTLGRFRNLLVKNGLQQQFFEQVLKTLTKKGLILKKGTIVDSTIIESPTSTKNQEKERDPEAHQVKKGNAWHFGYKAHVSVDKDSGIVHTVEVTSANVHDVTMVPKLLTGEESVVYGDSGYLGAEKRDDALTHNKNGKKITYKTNRRPSQSKNKGKRAQAQIKRREHEKSSVRAKVEHVFATKIPDFILNFIAFICRRHYSQLVIGKYKRKVKRKSSGNRSFSAFCCKTGSLPVIRQSHRSSDCRLHWIRRCQCAWR